MTFQIDHEASVRLAELAKAAGAKRFVYTSSCSVYGFAQGPQQLHDVFARIGMDRSTFEAKPFTRLKQLKYLSATGQIDDRFFWRY